MSDEQNSSRPSSGAMDNLRTQFGPAAFETSSPDQTIRASRTDAPDSGVLHTVRPADSSTSPTEISPRKHLSAADVPTMVGQQRGTQPGATTNVFSSGVPSALTGPRMAQWDEYEIKSELARGGMGVVYVAEQHALRRDVAIKKIIPGRREGANARAQESLFISEALITGFLDHPNIAPVHGFGQDNEGNWFFSMKLVSGMEWKQLMHPSRCKDREKRKKAEELDYMVDEPAQRKKNLEKNLRVLLSVCNAVAFAHSKGIINRDLKPDNVMVGAFGEVLVMDWGLSVDVSLIPRQVNTRERRAPSKTDCTLGYTPSYAAPEQVVPDAQGRLTRLSLATDVFLLGGMLHEIITGRPTYTGKSGPEVTELAAQCPIPGPFEGVPPELAEICKKALAKDPRERYHDATDFQKALDGFLTHHEAMLVAAKAAQEAHVPEIKNLSRAVALYDQALELWPDHYPFYAARQKTQETLVAKEHGVKRLRRIAAGLAAAFLAGLTVGSALIYRGYRNEQNLHLQAHESETKAHRAGSKLLQTLNSQIGSVQDELNNVPGVQSLKKKMLKDALDGLKEASEIFEQEDATNPQYAIAYSRLGGIYYEINETATALDYYKKALTIRQDRMKRDQSPESRRDLAESYSLVGKLTEQQDVSDNTSAVDEAHTNYKASLQLRIQLSNEQPGDITAKRDVAASYTEIGNLYAKYKKKEAETARDMYKQAFDLRKEIAADPRVAGNEGVLRDLARAYNNMGDARLKSASTPQEKSEALKHYEESLAIVNKLGDKSAPTLLDRAYTYDKIGRYHEASAAKSADPEASFKLAAENYQFAFAIRSKLVQDDEGNYADQRKLSESNINLGNIKFLTNDKQGGLTELRRALEIRQKLARFEDKNIKNKRNLAEIYHLLASKLIEMEDADRQRGLESFREALAIRGTLARIDNKNDADQLALFDTSLDYALAVLRVQSDVNYAELNELYSKIKALKTDGATVGSKEKLTDFYLKTGDKCRDWKDNKAALEAYEKAADTADKLGHAKLLNRCAAALYKCGAATRAFEVQTRAVAALSSDASPQQRREFEDALSTYRGH